MRALLKAVFEAAMPPEEAALYSQHSGRAGAATAAFAAGASLEQVARAGRWAPRSTAPLAYNRPTPAQHAQQRPAMCHAGSGIAGGRAASAEVIATPIEQVTAIPCARPVQGLLLPPGARSPEVAATDNRARSGPAGFGEALRPTDQIIEDQQAGAAEAETTRPQQAGGGPAAYSGPAIAYVLGHSRASEHASTRPALAPRPVLMTRGEARGRGETDTGHGQRPLAAPAAPGRGPTDGAPSGRAPAAERTRGAQRAQTTRRATKRRAGQMTRAE